MAYNPQDEYYALTPAEMLGLLENYMQEQLQAAKLEEAQSRQEMEQRLRQATQATINKMKDIWQHSRPMRLWHFVEEVWKNPYNYGYEGAKKKK